MSKKDKKIVLFDIDNTLIDSEKIGRLCTKKIVQACNTSNEKFEKILNRYVKSLNSSTDFNPDELSELLTDNFKVSSILLKKIIFEKKR